MTRSPSHKTVVLAAGGTGGHVFPAEALAAELLARGHRPILITDRRGQAFKGALADIECLRIRAGGIAGRGMIGKIRGAVELGLGTWQARALLKRLAPDAVIGFGGYAALPTVFAATLLKIPTAIHEQNAVLGRANRLLAGRVRQIATAYETVQKLPSADASKAVRTGMPVRANILDRHAAPFPELTVDGPVRLLVLGGSQGARILSDVIPAALAALPDALRQRIVISQQCRPEDLENVRAAYRTSGISADLESFFNDVPDRLAASHLVIARSGASTIAELSVIGRPSLLVPYPYAIDDHQTANAEAMADAKAAWLIPQSTFTPQGLVNRLEALLDSPDTLRHAASHALAAGVPDAAARLADLVEGLTSNSVSSRETSL